MFGTRASGKAALIADIDDSSVGVSVVETSHEGPVIVLASERMMLSLENRDASQSAAGIIQLLEQCVDKVLKAYMGVSGAGSKSTPAASLGAVHVVLRTPWTRFRTAEAEETFPEPRAITKEMIPGLAKKAMQSITDLDASAIVESGVMQVTLNGYPTANPLGKKARTIGVIAFESDANQEIKKGLTEVFGKLLPGRTPVIRSGMRALLTVLHEHIPDIHRYVILDMGGSSTGCVVVRKEMITQSEEVHEGFATVIKRISGTGLPEETLGQLRMLVNDTCSTDACRTMKDSLAKAEPELVKAYGEVFGKLAERRRLPNRAILAAPADFVPWLETFFSRIDFGQFTATTQPLEVVSLTPEHLKDVVSWKAGAARDTELAIGAACVRILEQTT